MFRKDLKFRWVQQRGDAGFNVNCWRQVLLLFCDVKIKNTKNHFRWNTVQNAVPGPEEDSEGDNRERDTWTAKDFLPKFQDCGGLYSRMAGPDPSLQEGHRTTKGPLVPARRISWTGETWKKEPAVKFMKKPCLGGKPEAFFQGRIDPLESGHVLFSGKMKNASFKAGQECLNAFEMSELLEMELAFNAHRLSLEAYAREPDSGGIHSFRIDQD